MNSADITDIRFVTTWLASLAKERAAKDRAYRDMQRTARARVACRITILSEYRKRRMDGEEPERGGAA